MPGVKMNRPLPRHDTRPPWMHRPDVRALGLVVVAAFAARLVHLTELSRLPLFDRPTVDAALYLDAARTWAQGGLPPVFFKPPLYPALLAALWHFCGDQFLLLRLLGAVAGTATCGLVWWIARRWFGPRIALVAGLLYALHRTAVYFEGELLELGVATLLHVGSLALLLRAGSPGAGRRSAVVAGLGLGIASLARPTLLVFAIAALVWLGRRRALPLLAGIALGVAPVTLHNAVRGHDFVLVASNFGLNYYLGNNPRADGRSAAADDLPANPGAAERAARTLAETARGRPLRPSEVSAYWFRRGLAFDAAEPLQAAGLALRKLFFAWNAAEISDNDDLDGLARHLHWLGHLPVGTWLLAPLGLAGLILAPRRRAVGLGKLYVFSHVASLLPFFVVARFRLPWMPVLAIFAAWTIVELLERLRHTHAGRLQVAAVVAIAGLACSVPAFGVRAPIDFDFEYKLAYAYQQEGQIDTAIATYRAAVERNPNHALALNALGVLVSERGGDRAEAERLVTRALDLDAGHGANFAESLAGIRLQRQDARGALAACETGLQAKPDAPTGAALLWRRAAAYRMLGATDDERTALAAALATGALGGRESAARQRLAALGQPSRGTKP